MYRDDNMGGFSTGHTVARATLDFSSRSVKFLENFRIFFYYRATSDFLVIPHYKILCLPIGDKLSP